MKNIKWQDVKSQHDNDCWAIAISKAVGKTYKEIYKLFEPFADSKGLLSQGYTETYLEENFYEKINMSNQTVQDIIQLYDTKNNKMIIRYKNSDDTGHVFYVENDTIFDNEDIEYRGYTYNKKVDYIMYKPID